MSVTHIMQKEKDEQPIDDKISIHPHTVEVKSRMDTESGCWDQFMVG